MRKSSVYSARASHATNSSIAAQASSAQLNAKLLEKKKEYDALQALERSSEAYVRRMEAFDVDCNLMADSGKGEEYALMLDLLELMKLGSRTVLGDVLAQWPEMFRILSLSGELPVNCCCLIS